MDIDQTNNSISSIEASMRERLNTLQSEQENLQRLQMQLDAQIPLLENEKIQNKTIRRCFLQALNKRNEIELQLLETLDHCDKLRMETHHLTTVSTPIIQGKTDSIRKEHEHLDLRIYTAHLTDMSIQQQVMEGKIHNYKKKKRKREALLNRLALDTNKYYEDAEETIQKTLIIKQQIEQFESVEGQQNEEISAISIQIRALLNKRGSLRDVLYAAREENRVANDEMLRLEEERFGMTMP